MLNLRDDVELYQCVCELGFDIPTVAPTTGQQSPFEALADLYFGRTQRGVIMAARGSGKSQLLAILAVLLCLKQGGTVVLNFAAVERQSEIVMGYASQLAKLPQLRPYCAENLQSRIVWHNDSKIILSSAGADSSTVGVHGHVVILDELDTWPSERLQNALLCLTGDDDRPGLIAGASTRYRSGGLLDQLAGDQSWTLYQFDFWASLRPCTECKGADCSLFTWHTPEGQKPFCRGRALWSRGFRPLDDVLNLFRATSRETWRVQQLLFDPMGAGRLWPNFSPDRHIGEPPAIDGAPIVVGLDWGQSPAIIVGAKFDYTVWVVEELGGPGVQIEDMRAYLLDLRARHGDFAIWCGAHDQLTQPMQTRWAEDGLTVIPVYSQFDFRDVRHDEIRKLLDLDPATNEPGLMFSEGCPRTIRQVRLAKASSEQGRRKDDDFRDALGYMVAGLAISDGATLPGGAFMA